MAAVKQEHEEGLPSRLEAITSALLGLAKESNHRGHLNSLKDIFCSDALTFPEKLELSRATIPPLSGGAGEKLSVNLALLRMVSQYLDTYGAQCLQIGCTLFPMTFVNVLEKSDDYVVLWDALSLFKTAVLEMLLAGVAAQIMRARFLALVVQIQTPTPPRDPRKREKKAAKYADVSISMARSHPLITDNLRAEAMAYIDRIVDMTLESAPVALAAFFALTALFKARPNATSSAITQGLLRYESARRYVPNHERVRTDPQVKIRAKLDRRFVDRAYKTFFDTAFKAGFSEELGMKHRSKVGAIVQHQDAQKSAKNLLLDTPEDLKQYEYLDHLEDEQRVNQLVKQGLLREDVGVIQRCYPAVLLQELTQAPTQPTLYSALFTLSDAEIAKFDALVLSHDHVTRIAMKAVARADADQLQAALDIVCERYRQAMQQAPQKQEVEAEDGDMEYVLPPPPPMSDDERREHVARVVTNFLRLGGSKEMQRVINAQDKTDDAEGAVRMAKVAILRWNKSLWVTVLVRMATRGMGGGYGDIVRELIFNHFLENIQGRMEIVSDWLNEEWYAEYVEREAVAGGDSDPSNVKQEDSTPEDPMASPVYVKWTTKVLDLIIPFLELKDRRIFIRLFLDLPYLNQSIILRLRLLCLDQMRFNLGLQTLQYLAMFRPPVRSICEDLLMEVYGEAEGDAKAAAEKLVRKICPSKLN